MGDLATNFFTAVITAYCSCAPCCGKANQSTASGIKPQQGITVAAPRSIPLGTRVFIQSIGYRVVQDRTALKYDGRWDIYFKSHRKAKKFGKQNLVVYILNP